MRVWAREAQPLPLVVLPPHRVARRPRPVARRRRLPDGRRPRYAQQRVAQPVVAPVGPVVRRRGRLPIGRPRAREVRAAPGPGEVGRDTVAVSPRDAALVVADLALMPAAQPRARRRVLRVPAPDGPQDGPSMRGSLEARAPSRSPRPDARPAHLTFMETRRVDLEASARRADPWPSAAPSPALGAQGVVSWPGRVLGERRPTPMAAKERLPKTRKNRSCRRW